jgi:hypothetical protein
MRVVRVSILTLPPEHLDEAARMLAAAEEELEGIKSLPGLVSYHTGVDRTKNQLVNVSFWQTTADAEQMSTFQPMLDLAARMIPLGATFLRPIPNFEIDWEWLDVAPRRSDA